MPEKRHTLNHTTRTSKPYICGTNVLQKENRKETMGSATHGLKQTQLAAQRYGYNRPTLVACGCFQAGKRLNYTQYLIVSMSESSPVPGIPSSSA